MARKKKIILQRPADVVIDELGVRPLARELELNPTSVMRWRNRCGLVPSRYHQDILRLGEGRITDSDLIHGRTKAVVKAVA